MYEKTFICLKQFSLMKFWDDHSGNIRNVTDYFAKNYCAM